MFKENISSCCAKKHGFIPKRRCAYIICAFLYGVPFILHPFHGKCSITTNDILLYVLYLKQERAYEIMGTPA